MRRVLVTGANGFLAGHLLARLRRRDDLAVVATGRQPQFSPNIASAGPVDYAACDLADRGAVRKLFQDGRFDAIIQVAAALPNPGEQDFHRRAERDNAMAQSVLIAAAAEQGCRDFIFCSSISVYGPLIDRDRHDETEVPQPSSAYGVTKLAAEAVLGEAADRFSCAASLRFPGLHGPGRISGAVYQFARAALRNAPIEVKEPDSLFHFLFAQDAAAALELVLDRPLKGAFNVAGAAGISLTELARQIVDISGSKSAIIETRGSTPRRELMDTSRFRQVSGFEPAPLDVRLREMVDWLKKSATAIAC